MADSTDTTPDTTAGDATDTAAPDAGAAPETLDAGNTYRQPTYALTINGRDITPRLNGRLIRLSLSETRGEEADQLEVELSDHDGALPIPPKGAKVQLRMGYVGLPMFDKGEFVVDEAGHRGTPDVLSFRARSANLAQGLRQRTSRSWHATTLGQVVQDLAAANGLQAKVGEGLAAKPVQHIDQTNESPVHFLTRIGRQYDAVATVKKGMLLFLPIGGATTASGKPMPAVLLTRRAGDQHDYSSAERDAYTGVRAEWHDARANTRKAAIAGTETNLKTLKSTYATEADALAAAQAEMGRIVRGKATLTYTLATGQPALAPQTPVTVQGFKPEIDGTAWLVKKVEHEMGDGGYTTRLEMERGGGDDDDDKPGKDNDD
ncbi:contractile injection system protein, VgrG/Pvc8 family [Comamonas sp. J-3]|uniref:contractile injection system protein, VgrG/Pvc8 family n=1 Tax=Comamonas trifloxystrobinivorans TaxID=3350256 RepID=UPI00372B9A7A